MKKFGQKVTSVILAAALAMSAIGCGSDNGTTADTAQTGTAADAAATDTPAADTADSGSDKTAAPAETTELTFWFANGDTVQTYIEDAADRFNNTVGAEKGIHVTAEYQGDYVELHQKLQAAYISGTAPDLTVLEIGAVGMFADGGMVQPLDSFITADSYDMTDFHDGLLYNCYVNDSCYSIPFLRSTSLLYMNATLLEQAGVDPDSIVTWDDVAAASEAVKENTGKYGFSIPMNYWFWEAFMLTEGGFTVNEDETECTVDNEVSRKILSYFQDLMDRGLAHIYSYAEADKMSADLMNQDAAFFFQSTGGLAQMKAIADELGFELQTAFIPKGTQYGVTTGGCNLAMLSGLSDEKQQAAWEFIKWMSTTDETVKASIATGYLATRKSALEDQTMIDWYTAYPQYKVALDQLEYSSGRPLNPGYQEFQSDLTTAISDILVTGADVDTTLADLQTKGTQLLNEY